ncbi:SDR family oxidoreductase [Nocardia stercoris]|uniref:NAD-dependent epimerase/dehydratase family protein n=1 Tax=Nocardia stercoris TaxID=2483361 RepID=A0A3M2L3U2_9NOCA|nr:NAD(P)H-binding protein [Nocardia stercoris]RMI31173.1 NAD-dependent epimerase/dehydratase family protein [Nocardia stercoris]
MIVVTGATGNVGRVLVPALVATGEQVVAVSRGITPAEPPAVPHRTAELSDSSALREILDGADALFLMIAGAQHFGGVDPQEVLDVAKTAGVRRVVLLSSQAAATRPELISHQRLRDFEAAVRDADLDWTILRPGGFHSNALAWAPQVRATRTVAAPFADTGLRTIHPADIAEVAARALVDSEHLGQTYLLLGPELVSPRRQAAAIGAAIGQPVDFVELSYEQALFGMAETMPEPVARGVLELLGNPTAEELRPSPDVERVLGRAPRTFAEWARSSAPAFAP